MLYGCHQLMLHLCKTSVGQLQQMDEVYLCLQPALLVPCPSSVEFPPHYFWSPVSLHQKDMKSEHVN